MATSINILCYKSKTLANGAHPLMIRVCKDGKKKYHSLGLAILPEHWDFEKNKPKRNCPKISILSKQGNEESIEMDFAQSILKGLEQGKRDEKAILTKGHTFKNSHGDINTSMLNQVIKIVVTEHIPSGNILSLMKIPKEERFHDKENKTHRFRRTERRCRKIDIHDPGGQLPPLCKGADRRGGRCRLSPMKCE